MRFLGLVNYFSDFVDHFADIAKPLYSALKGMGLLEESAATARSYNTGLGPAVGVGAEDGIERTQEGAQQSRSIGSSEAWCRKEGNDEC